MSGSVIVTFPPVLTPWPRVGAPQVTTPPLYEPPFVAETNVAPAGSGYERKKFEAMTAATFCAVTVTVTVGAVTIPGPVADIAISGWASAIVHVPAKSAS